MEFQIGTSSPRADRGHKKSMNIQVSRPLLDLRGRRVVVLQKKVLQFALLRQLLDNVAESFTFCLFAQNRGILCSLTAALLTPLVPMWQLDLAFLAVFPFPHWCSWR